MRRNHDNWGPICVNEDFENHITDNIPEYINRVCNTLETSIFIAWESLHVGTANFDSGFSPPNSRGKPKTRWPNWGNIKCHKQRVLYLSCDNGMLKIKMM